jgi:hypothetical protein
MGVVLLAEQIDIQTEERFVALKFPLGPYGEQIMALEGPAAQMLAASSPYFPRVFQVSTRGRVYMAMELLRRPWQEMAQFLDERRSAGRSLTALEVAELGIELLRGLRAMEIEGLVHCDLKPENLFVSTIGQLRVKLFDLGVWVRSRRKKQGESVLAGETQRLRGMTLAYMSPEQCRAWESPDEAITTASDIHTVGSILWKAATGEVPYPTRHTGPTLQDVRARLHALATAPARPAAMPAALHDVLATALRFDPANRRQGFGSAEWISEGMELALAGFLERERAQARAELAGLRARAVAVQQAIQGFLPRLRAAALPAERLDSDVRALVALGDDRADELRARVPKVEAALAMVKDHLRDLALPQPPPPEPERQATFYGTPRALAGRAVVPGGLAIVASIVMSSLVGPSSSSGWMMLSFFLLCAGVVWAGIGAIAPLFFREERRALKAQGRRAWLRLWPVWSTIAGVTLAVVALLAADGRLQTCAYGDFQDCRTRCDRGSATSCARLGHMTSEVGDHLTAFKLFERGCKLGSTNGCEAVFHRLEAGEGVAQDRVAAAQGFKRLCGDGSGYACWRQAALVRSSDHALADSLLATACSHGEPRACDEMARNALRPLPLGDAGPPRRAP